MIQIQYKEFEMPKPAHNSTWVLVGGGEATGLGFVNGSQPPQPPMPGVEMEIVRAWAVQRPWETGYGYGQATGYGDIRGQGRGHSR